ncbi:MAG: ATP-binding cassette domain-containing protein, partial [Solibacillus sp.]
MSEILSFNQVTYSYTPEEPHTQNAVEDVSFTINKGEWITIVGHNGSGKSTMAKLMSGLLMPQQGEVRIKREILTEENI